MDASILAKLDAARKQLEEELGFTRPLRDLADFAAGVNEAKGAEQVACAASGAMGLKRGQKGSKAKLAKEIAKRTKSKVLAAKAKKLAQEY